MTNILNKIKNFFPNKMDDPDTRYFKVTLFLILGLFGTMILIGVIVSISQAQYNTLYDSCQVFFSLKHKKMIFFFP